MADPTVVGPFRRAVKVTHGQLSLGHDANRHLMWNRLAIEPFDAGRKIKLAQLVSKAGPETTALGDAAMRRRRRATERYAGARSLTCRHLSVSVSSFSDLAIAHSGASSANDNSIALDPVLGTPTLPATAIKGVVRAASAPEDGALFGSPADANDSSLQSAPGKGSLTFLGGLATSDVWLGLSVLTVHEPLYYDDPAANPPGAYEAPKPVPFPVVRSGTFNVTMVGPAAAIDRATALLGVAGDETGIGAKSSSGYGFYTVTQANE